MSLQNQETQCTQRGKLHRNLCQGTSKSNLRIIKSKEKNLESNNRKILKAALSVGGNNPNNDRIPIRNCGSHKEGTYFPSAEMKESVFIEYRILYS
jgi:plasmid stability protein